MWQSFAWESILLIGISVLLICPAATADEKTAEHHEEDWSFHFQTTAVPQMHDSFHSAYSGQNSLSPFSDSNTSLTSTLFLGRRLWREAEIYFNPELSAGSGFSGTHGIAGFPNGEIYRVDTAEPKGSISRIYVMQTFNLGGEGIAVEAGKNQLAGMKTAERLSIGFGKFSLNDFFDTNQYSHDPRTQFLNWALMDNAAWDYAADTRGYTWGVAIEYDYNQWAARIASVLEPKEANQLDFDLNIAHAQGNNFEIERHFALFDHPGAIRLLSYLNHANMGNYAETLSNPEYGMDITRARAYRAKYGFGINLEQEVAQGIGVFSRMGWNEGANETWAFTEVDRTLTLGASIKASAWHRPDDVFGLALIINGLSQDHANYLAAGGYGFLIGDGALSYAPEQILETYYSIQVLKVFAISADYQFVNHPAYNSDRGPVSIISARAHFEF